MIRHGSITIPHAQTQADRRPRHHSLTAAALSAAALCLSVLASPAAAQRAAPNLFAEPPGPSAAGPHGLEAVEGIMDAAPALRGLGRLRLQLPGGGMVQMARDGFERRRNGDVTWRGRIVGEDDSRVILTVKDGYMAGWIQRGLDEYEIRPGPGQSHVIERVDTSVEHEEYLIAQDEAGSGPTGDFLSTTTTLMAGDTADNIQLLVTYSPMAREWATGTERIKVWIQSLVDRANAAFIDSGMTARYALVHTAEVPFVETTSLANIYNAVEWLQTRADVAALRDRYGADMVSIIVHDNGRCEGAAYVMRDPGPAFESMAFQATSLNCSGTTFAHEHGHNMGFEHDPANGALPAEASYPWSYGHFVDGAFRTIMSYSNQCTLGCPRVLQFSNPDIVFQGAPTGIADERDNARTGELTAPIVAAFRPAVTGAVVNRGIDASIGDVEEAYDGTIYTDNPTLELGGDTSGIHAIGLRFQNLSIPQGAIIKSAYLGFEAAVDDSVNAMTLVDIRAEAADNASPFSTVAFDVTNRPATLASVAWDIQDWPWANQKRFSPDISTIIQEVVNRPGWIENNSMVLTISGTGVRRTLSYDGLPASAPLLHVEYTSPGDPPPVNMAPGAHFSFGCGASEHCSFTDLSIDVDGTIVAWSWDFGDLSTSTAQNPTHSYATPGTYTVTLTVTDNEGGVDSVSDSVTILTLAPVATDNAYTTDEERPVSGNVISDGVPDSDPEGASLEVVANTDPSSGVVAMSTFFTGSFTYTPNPDFNGTDSFTYTVSDGQGGRATATVTITVNPVNDPPVAGSSSYILDEDVPISGNVLTDGTPDSDIDGDTLSATLYFGPSNGSVSLNPDGTFTYTPNANFNGSDVFSYTVSDGNGGTDIGGAWFSVLPVNDAPVAAVSHSCNNLDCAFTDASTDVEGAIVSWAWSFGDGAVSSLQNPAHSYAAAGTYPVTLTVTDGDGAMDTATVSVAVDMVNETPVASFSYSCAGLNCAFTDGSTDAEGAIAAWSWAFGDGAVSTVQNPTHSYAADGTYTVSLTVTDGQGVTDMVTQTVMVANTAPVATANAYTIAEDTAGAGNVLNDGVPDSDVDGDVLTVTANSSPLNGTVTVAADGAFTYSPTPDFNGPDSFTYTIGDGNGGSATATITVTVTPVNDVPVATPNSYTTLEDTALSGNVMLDGTPDSDVDGDPITVVANTSPGIGTVTMSPDGAFTYTPAPDSTGLITFTYTISDGNGSSAKADVIVIIDPVNDAPVAAFTHSCTGLTCTFTDGSSDPRDIGGSIVSWSWAFGDGAVSAEPSPAHSYATGGNYTVSLTVTDNQGATDTVTQSVTVANTVPVATDNAYTTAEDVAVSGNVLTDGTPDSDADGDPLTVTANTGPLNGTVTVAATGAFTYTPNADFSGSDSFTYTVSDGVASATATVSITVTAVNDAPVATDNAYTTAEDVAVSGNVLLDGTPDSDADGDPLTVTANTSPLNGAVTVAANGAFTYTPNPDFSGTDGFIYTLSDGVASATATVTITVNPVNDAPVATDNAYTTAEDVAVSGNVLLDGTPDGDPDGDALSVISNTSPLNGTVAVATTGAFSYTPNVDFNGSDSFTYTVSDGTATATATVTITVTPVNDAPVASFSFNCAGLNCAFTDGSTDIEGAIGFWSWSFGDGAVSSVQNPTHRYSLDGTYTVSLTVTDGGGATATVTQSVTAANTAPVATDNGYTTSEDTALGGNVLTDGTPDSDADGDALTVTTNSTPLNGTVTVAANGAFTYTPNADFNGTDSFTYTVSDGIAAAIATVTITVTPVNDGPVATDNVYATVEDTAVGGNLLTDGVPDSDVDGDVLTVVANTNPLNGAVTVAPSGAFTYTPNPDFGGSDSFAYTVSDGFTTATATVTITVSPVNDAPVATADAYSTAEDVAVSGNVLLDGTPDSDADGDLLSLTASTTPSNGAVTVAANGAFTYTPDLDFNGLDSFTYTVSDGTATATATVTITVNPVNDAPVATANSYTTSEDTSLTGNLQTDGTPDSDADGDALAVTANTAPMNGTVTMAANGAFTYTPNADFNGTDSFTYTVSDGVASATATVTMTVVPVNDAPVAGFGSACTDLDCVFTDASTDIDGTVAAWSWDFGDGTVSTAQSPTHSYPAVDGTYTVSLTVTDDSGASDTIAKSVTVVNPFPPTAPANLSFAVTATGNGSKAILSVTLNWADTAINEESFVIERCEILGGGGNATCVYAPVATVGADTTFYTEDLPLSSYRYRIKARNRNGDSGYSNVIEIRKQQV